MKFFYGKKLPKADDSLYLDESDISIPTGRTFHELPVSLLRDIEKTIIDKKPVYQIFNYSNISLWWFIYPTIFATFARSIFFIKNFEKLVEDHNPESIKIIGDFNKLEIIKQICKKHQIKFQYSYFSYLIYKIKDKVKKTIQPRRYRKITNKKRKQRLELFHSVKKQLPSLTNNVVFFVPTSYRRDVYDSRKNKITRGEYPLEPIFEMMKKFDKEIIGIDIDYSFVGNPEILSERLQEQNNWFPVEAILEQTIHNNESSFIKKYKKIINDDKFRTLFTYNDIKIWDSLNDDFQMLSYAPYIPLYIEMYESFRNFLKNQKPKVVFLPYETGPFALCLICACIEKKIKTVGIQHGGLIVQHPDYIHDIFHSTDNPYGMPIPDTLMVFGEYYKNALIKQANYPSDKIMVFGNPVYFDIDQILKQLDPQQIKKKYNIPSNKKIILFTTALFQKYYSQGGHRDYDEQILEEIAKKFSSKEQYVIIIKPHPSETYLESYKKILEKYNCKNFIIQQGNLFELIHISDIVISVFSTSLIDSVLLNTPTIRVTFPGTEVAEIFTDNNIFLESNLEQLEENMIELLENDDLRKRLLHSRKNFILKNYNIPNPNSITQIESLL